MHAHIQIPMYVWGFCTLARTHTHTHTNPVCIYNTSYSLLDFSVLCDTEAETGKKKDATNEVNVENHCWTLKLWGTWFTLRSRFAQSAGSRKKFWSSYILSYLHPKRSIFLNALTKIKPWCDAAGTNGNLCKDLSRFWIKPHIYLAHVIL